MNGNHYILNLDLIHSVTDPDQTLFQVPFKGNIVALDENNLLTFIVDPVWNRIIYANYNDDWVNAYGTAEAKAWTYFAAAEPDPGSEWPLGRKRQVTIRFQKTGGEWRISKIGSLFDFQSITVRPKSE